MDVLVELVAVGNKSSTAVELCVRLVVAVGDDVCRASEGDGESVHGEGPPFIDLFLGFARHQYGEAAAFGFEPGPGWWWIILRCDRTRQTRSEEHTSELQSQSNLVCRLLLE